MGPLLVVVGKVAGEIAGQAVELGHEAPGEGWPPALFQDGPLDPLDGAVGGRTSSSDEAVASAQIAQRLVELGAAELAAVVGEDALQTSAMTFEIGRHSSNQGRGLDVALSAEVVDLVRTQAIEGVDQRKRVRQVPMVEMEARLA